MTVINTELKLKCCPFCGAKADMNEGSLGKRFVTCSDDNCGGRRGLGICGNDEEVAARVWNDRPAEPGRATVGEQHDQLDIIVAQFITDTKGLPSKSSILELLEWSHKRCVASTENDMTGELEGERAVGED